MTDTATRETLGFQAEVKQLLHLMVHSLYGHKEIFLRELVSNASDACDRLRFDAISDGALLEDDADLKIRVSYDKQARTITVSDNGIGMSRQEVDRSHRHDCEVGHARVLPDLDLRSRQGRAAHRSVRRRLLRLLHRRRSGHVDHAPRRPHGRTRRPLGERRRRRLHHRNDRSCERAAPT